MSPSFLTASLIEMLPTALAGNRKLDADIYEACGFTVKREPERVDGSYRMTRGWAYLSQSRWVAMLNLTSDLSDAVRFCEQILPEAQWVVSSQILPPSLQAQFASRPFGQVMVIKETGAQPYSALAASPALALCPALLCALKDGETQ